MSAEAQVKVVTVPGVIAQKGVRPLTMLTAYDYPTASLVDEAGIDLILVGDSLGTVIYGEPNTLSVSMEQMLMHTRAVTRGAKRALVVGDMPFMSYQTGEHDALLNAARFVKEARAQAVKLEGGVEWAPTVRAIVRAGIPVCGHIGLMPQSIHAMGNYRTFGKTEGERAYLMESALALEAAGAFAIVLECVEVTLAREISARLRIPTIGIGAGDGCDGQVLVFHDLVGLTMGRVPKFVSPTANVKETLQAALVAYRDRVTGARA